METKSTQLALWAALLVTFPVPYWVMEGGWVPTFWLFEVSGFTLAVLLAEGGSINALLTGLFLTEAALAAFALYGVARLGSRALHRHLSPTARMAAVVVLVVLLFGTALTGVYSTPLVAEGRPINLLQLIA